MGIKGQTYSGEALRNKQKAMARVRRVHNEKIADGHVEHGHARRGPRGRTYNIWVAMRARTRNGRESYKNVRVDSRWDKFANFLADMGEAPEGKSIDRFPNKRGNYEPGNCRWATPREQAENTKTNRLLPLDDGTMVPLSRWSKICGKNEEVVRSQLRRGWTIEEMRAGKRNATKKRV
jgi:hypothetical protein